MAVFDRAELVKRLGGLPGSCRLAFACACAARLAAPYKQAAALEGAAGRDLVDTALADLRNFMAGEPPTDWALLAEMLVERIPDEDHANGPASYVLDDALAATAYAARTAIAFDPDEAANGAQRVYDAVDAYAQRSFSFPTYSPEIERLLLEHPAVQEELNRQQRDLALLESGGANAALTLFRGYVESAFILPEVDATAG